ncbi:MAG: hypothetical protein V1863_07185, partial [Candidatus Omnitrophota bacterium]
MKKIALAVLLISILYSAGSTRVFAKTKSLHDIEGDRKIFLNIDRRAKLPKPYLKKRKAQAYIGSLDDLKQKVTANHTTSENVIRHAKSPRFLNLSDGIIFNTNGGKIGYVERRDGSYIVIIDYPDGRKLDVVDEPLFEK